MLSLTVRILIFVLTGTTHCTRYLSCKVFLQPSNPTLPSPTLASSFPPSCFSRRSFLVSSSPTVQLARIHNRPSLQTSDIHSSPRCSTCTQAYSSRSSSISGSPRARVTPTFFTPPHSCSAWRTARRLSTASGRACALRSASRRGSKLCRSSYKLKLENTQRREVPSRCEQCECKRKFHCGIGAYFPLHLVHLQARKTGIWPSPAISPSSSISFPPNSSEA